MHERKLQTRSVPVIYLLSIVTFGIYSIVWTVQSKRDMNALGGDIPTSFLLLIPFVNLFYVYKYSEAYACHIKKDDNTLVWFLVFSFFGIIAPLVVQSDLNKIIEAKSPKTHKDSHSLKAA